MWGSDCWKNSFPSPSWQANQSTILFFSVLHLAFLILVYRSCWRQIYKTNKLKSSQKLVLFCRRERAYSWIYTYNILQVKLLCRFNWCSRNFKALSLFVKMVLGYFFVHIKQTCIKLKNTSFLWILLHCSNVSPPEVFDYIVIDESRRSAIS